MKNALFAALFLSLIVNVFGTGLSSITNVYTGTGPNTGTGDPAVTAFGKINSNTLILSNAVAAAQSGAAPVGSATNAINDGWPLPFNGYQIKQMVQSNFQNNVCSKFVWLGDSYAGDPFGGPVTNYWGAVSQTTAWPAPRRVIDDFYQAAYEWYSTSPSSSSFALPPPGVSGDWFVGAGYQNVASDPDPAYFGVDGAGHLLNCPLANVWWGLHGGGQETYGTFTNCNDIIICWWQWPMGGNDLLVYTNGVLFTTLNGFSSLTTTNSAGTNFYLPTGKYLVELLTSDTSHTNMVYFADGYNNTNGIHCWYAQCGGTTPGQIIQSFPLYTNFLKAESPQATIWLDKHLDATFGSTYVSNMVDSVFDGVEGAYVTNSLFAIVGSGEEGVPAALSTGAYVNMIYWQMCQESNWIYLDLHTDNSTHTNLLSWDTIHYSPMGFAWAGAKLEEEMGFPAGADSAVSLFNAAFGNNAWETNFPNIMHTNTDGTLRLAGGNNTIYLGSGGMVVSNQNGGGNVNFGVDDGHSPTVNGANNNFQCYNGTSFGSWNWYSRDYGQFMFSINGFSGSWTADSPAGSGQMNIDLEGNQVDRERIGMYGGNTGPNSGQFSFYVSPLIGLPGGYNALTSETNGVAEVYSNLWINVGSVYVTNGVFAVGATTSYRPMTNGLQSGTHLLWTSNSVPTSATGSVLYDVNLNGNSTTANALP